MIEPRYAGQIGVHVNIELGDQQALDRALIQIPALGTRLVRMHVTDAMFSDRHSLDHLLSRLGGAADILVSVDAGKAISGVDGLLTNLLHRHGHLVAAVELLDTADDDPMQVVAHLSDAMRLARDAGKDVVIGLTSACSADRMTMLSENGLLRSVMAVGLHVAPLASRGDVANDDLRTVLAGLRRIDRVIPLWLTSVGYTGPRHDLLGQLRMFVETIEAGAERIYWNALCKSSATDVQGRAPYGCLYDPDGQSTLLGRLLEAGVDGVKNVVALSTQTVTTPSIVGTKPILVTGGAGFIGANLVDRLANEGHHVTIYDALARPGVERNLAWLVRRHPKRVSFALGDLRDEPALESAAAQAEAVFHLAGQVAVTTSMVQPLADFEVNARGTVALLDALRRRNPTCPLIFASTNKVYGDLSDIELVIDADCYAPVRSDIRLNGVGEGRPLCFHTPYGCSKGAADQYVLDYAHSFGLRTAVIRMSCIYGERQLGTEDQGWVAHFLLRAMAGEQITIYGDGRQVRDILHVGDAVAAYMAMWRNIGNVAGKAYNLGGGPANAISLLQLIDHIEALLGKRMEVEFSSWRPGDQRYFVADTSAIRRDLALPKALDWRNGLARLAEHFGVTPFKSAQVKEAAL